MEIKEQIEAMAENVKTLVTDKEDQVKAIAEAKEVAEKSATEIAETKSKNEALEAELTEVKETIEVMEAKANRPVTAMEGKMEETKTALVDFIKSGEKDFTNYTKAMSVGSAADGGNLIPQTLAAEIMQLVTEISPLRQVCRVISMGNENFEQNVNVGGSTFSWNGENDTINGTATSQIQRISPKFGKATALPSVSEEIINDAPQSVESMIRVDISRDFAKGEGVAFLNGDGTKKPIGILSSDYIDAVESAKADGDRAFGKYQVLTTDGVGAIDEDDLLDLITSIKAAYRSKSVFMMNKNTLNEIRKLKDSNGRSLLVESLQEGTPFRLLGYTVIENEDMEDIGTGNKPIIFGDFYEGYTIVDVTDFNIEADPYTVKGAVSFYARKRVGGMGTNTEALKVLEIA